MNLSPDEIYQQIHHLDYPDIVQLCSTNRYLHQLCQTDRFRSLIQQKRKSVIPIKPISKRFIEAYSGFTGKNIDQLIEQPIPGNLIEINNRLYIVTDCSDSQNYSYNADDPIIPHDISLAYIVPVRRVVRKYAIVDFFRKSDIGQNIRGGI